MKWFWSILACLIGFPLLVLISGALLPPDHRVGISVHYKATPEAVWSALTDVENYPGWRSDVRKVEIIRRDPHLLWKERDKEGLERDFQEVDSRYPDKWSFATVDPSYSRGGSWIFHLLPAGDGGTE